MRLIDADALIRLVMDSTILGKEFKQAFVALVNGEPTVQPEPLWIPVTERLPEEEDYRPCYGYEDGAVWWCNDIGIMGLGWYYTSTDKWGYYDELEKHECFVGNVIAWMPLPEPYQGEAT